MSLLIEVDDVTSVLLADGWHNVDWRDSNNHGDPDGRRISTFSLDAYEFVHRYRNWDQLKTVDYHLGGQSGICATGFTFQEEGTWISGPLTAILAVQHDRRPVPPDPNYVARNHDE
jgi:hypothetical protein